MDYEQAWKTLTASIQEQHVNLQDILDKYGHTAPKGSPTACYIDGKLDILYCLALEAREIAKQHDLPNPLLADA